MLFRTRRLTLVIALALGGLGAALVGAQDAEAHACAQVRVEQNGSTTSVGSCHDKPCPSDHMGTGFDYSNGGRGAGFTVCVSD